MAQPDIRCIGYQHAILFPLQHAIRRNLTSYYNPDHILTAGLVGKFQLEASSGLCGIPVTVLGSNRAIIARSNNSNNHQNSLKKNEPQEQTCLVLPEGIPSECHLLFEFSLACAQKCPEIKFIWRLHPLLTFKSLTTHNPMLKRLPKNIILSQSSIEEDISCCNWVLYRGKTAVIMAVQAGLRPIYLQVQNEMTIDPLYEIKKGKITVTTVQEFQNGIASYNVTSQSSIKNNETTLKKQCENFFLPLNTNELIKSVYDSKK